MRKARRGDCYCSRHVGDWPLSVFIKAHPIEKLMPGSSRSIAKCKACRLAALTVRSGKGNKARIGYASRDARAALEKWLFLRGDEEGPLLLPVLKSGRIIHRRMTDQAVLSVLMKRAKQAGVKRFSDAPLSPTHLYLRLARCGCRH